MQLTHFHKVLFTSNDINNNNIALNRVCSLSIKKNLSGSCGAFGKTRSSYPNLCSATR